MPLPDPKKTKRILPLRKSKSSGDELKESSWVGKPRENFTKIMKEKELPRMAESSEGRRRPQWGGLTGDFN